MHSLNIARSTTVFGDWSAASGWQKTFELLHLQPRISAIVVANDQMALGVLSALAQLNRSGSRAVSVTGYDDTADSLYFQPPLTTVAQDFDLLGKRAVERLIALMAAPQLRIRELLPTRLIVRQSAWPVAAAEDRPMQALIYRQSYGGFFLPLPPCTDCFSPAFHLAYPAAAC